VLLTSAPRSTSWLRLAFSCSLSVISDCASCILQELFREIDSRKDEVSCEVALSYLEVYNETIRDLLDPSDRFLAIREDASKGASHTAPI
jgi:hypothetical protein